VELQTWPFQVQIQNCGSTFHNNGTHLQSSCSSLWSIRLPPSLHNSCENSSSTAMEKGTRMGWSPSSTWTPNSLEILGRTQLPSSGHYSSLLHFQRVGCSHHSLRHPYFCDASEHAYGDVAYLRSENEGQVKLSLALARSCVKRTVTKIGVMRSTIWCTPLQPHHELTHITNQSNYTLDWLYNCTPLASGRLLSL